MPTSDLSISSLVIGSSPQADSTASTGEAHSETNTDSPTHIHELPIELLLCILADLDSVNDVIAYSRSSRFAYDVVSDHELWIVRRHLRRLGPDRILSAAWMVLEARQIEDIDHDPLGEHCLKFFKNSFIIPELAIERSWSLEEAHQLARLHKSVVALREVFIDNCKHIDFSTYFDTWNSSALISETSPPSETEIHRIDAALYTYELYCTLFGHDPSFVFQGRAPLQSFFRSFFVPWELEQVASVYDVIKVAAYNSFRIVARYDVLYGYHQVEYDKRTSPEMRHVLESGVEFLHDLISAPHDFNSKAAVLRRQHGGDAIPKSLSFWPILYKSPGSITLNDLEGHDFAPFAYPDTLTGDPRWIEEDEGPRKVWEWVCNTGPEFNPDGSMSRPLVPSHRWMLRQAGYMFWDASRIQALDFTKNPFVRTPILESRRHVREQLELEGLPDVMSYRKRMVASWHARKLIFMDGGRGYFDFDKNDLIEYGYSKTATLLPTRGIQSQVNGRPVSLHHRR